MEIYNGGIRECYLLTAGAAMLHSSDSSRYRQAYFEGHMKLQGSDRNVRALQLSDV